MIGSLATGERQAIEELSVSHGEPDWLLQQRLKAWRLYEDMLPPSGEEEEWRRTDMRALSLDGLDLFDSSVPMAGATVRRARNGYGGEIAQSDGEILERRLSPDVERQGIVFSDLHAAAREHPGLFRANFMTEAVQPAAWKLVALHAALWKGGVFLYVPAGAEVTVPLHAAVGASAANAVFPHTLVVAEEGSNVTLVEEHASRGRHRFSSGVVEILVRDRARVRYVAVQDWSRKARNFATIRAIIGQEGRLELGVVGSGGRVTKDSIEAILAAPGGSAEIVGLFVAGGEQHMSYATLQDHRAPSTMSDLLFKSALRDSAQLVWNGLTRIHKGAGGSDANQSSRNLLLGENARVAPIPVLEIEAHDVARCSHGATVSSVDEEQLYYMMSRGLSRQEATQAIVDGFFRQGLARLSLVRGYDAIGRELERRLLAKVA
jgi:Fe-S cluster assembly protein SufD